MTVYRRETTEEITPSQIEGDIIEKDEYDIDKDEEDTIKECDIKYDTKPEVILNMEGSTEFLNIEEGLDENGAVCQVYMVDGRIDGSNVSTTLSVEPLHGDLLRIRLHSEHYAFSIKKSCVTRPLGSFYQLNSILKANNPYVQLPSLPLRATLWLSSYKYRSESLASFLSLVVKEKQLLSDKSLHLFLQTNLSMERIKENLVGLKDDEVLVSTKKLVSDTRTNSREGFQQVFGNSCRVKTSRINDLY